MMYAVRHLTFRAVGFLSCACILRVPKEMRLTPVTVNGKKVVVEGEDVVIRPQGGALRIQGRLRKV